MLINTKITPDSTYAYVMKVGEKNVGRFEGGRSWESLSVRLARESLGYLLGSTYRTKIKQVNIGYWFGAGCGGFGHGRHSSFLSHISVSPPAGRLPFA